MAAKADFDWKPVTLRWPFLSALFVCICGLIALLEYSLQVLPLADNRTAIPGDIGVSLIPPTTTTTTFTATSSTLSGVDRRHAAALPPRPSHIRGARQSRPRKAARADYDPPWKLSNATATANGTDTTKNTTTAAPVGGSGDDGLASPAIRIRPPGDYAVPEVLPLQYYTWGQPSGGWVDWGEGAERSGGPCPSTGLPAPDVGGQQSYHMCACLGFVMWDTDDSVGGCPYVVVGDNLIMAQGECRDRMAADFVAADRREADCSASRKAGGAAAPTIPVAAAAAGSAVPLPGITTVVKITGVRYQTDGSPTVATVTATTTGADGRATAFAVVTTLAAPPTTMLLTEVVTLLVPEAAVWQTAVVATLTDPINHRPTATVTSLPAGVVRGAAVTTVTLTDPADGRATATVVSTLPAKTTLLTLTDPADGRPTATVVGYAAFPDSPYGPQQGGAGQQAQHGVRMPGQADVFLGSFLPVLIATLLAIPLRMLDAHLRLLQPFRALARRRRRRREGREGVAGAAAAESLLLSTGALPWVRFAAVRAVVSGRGDALLPLLGALLASGAAALVAVSPLAVGLKLHGSCAAYRYAGCFMVLAIFETPLRAAEAILALTAAAVAGVFVVVVVVAGSGGGTRGGHGTTGLREDPWSVRGARRLLGAAGDGKRTGEKTGRWADGADDKYEDKEWAKSDDVGVAALIRELHGLAAATGEGRMLPTNIGEAAMTGVLEGWRFFLEEGRDGREYGLRAVLDRPTRENASRQRTKARKEQSKRHCSPPPMDNVLHVAFLFFLLGLLALILYYEMTTMDTSFEDFMDSQAFGVRVMFTIFGIITALFWDYFFSRMWLRNQCGVMTQSLQGIDKFSKESPPTTAFVGLYRAIQGRSPFMSVISFTAILSIFTPILLSNVPFIVTQTWTAHLITAWMTVAILAFMALVLVGSFFVKWPPMPVDPSTIVGTLYYLCDAFEECEQDVPQSKLK